MGIPTQDELSNFAFSLQLHDADLYEAYYEDLYIVSLWALGADKSGGQEAATRLRRMSTDLPRALNLILNSTLTDMGYS